MNVMPRKITKVLLCGIFAFLFTVNGNQPALALDIEQQNLAVSAHSSSITIVDAGISSGDFKITPKLEFNKLGDFITYELTVHNKDGKKYKITEVKDDNTNDAIELTYAYPTDLDTTDKSLDLTIKFVKKATTPLQTVTATISLVDEDDQSQQINIVVPNTGSNTIADTGSATIRNTILIYVAVATAIIVIYIIVRRKYQRVEKSTKLTKIITATLLLVGLIPVVVIAVSLKDLQLVVEFNDIKLNGPHTITFNATTTDTIQPQIVDHDTLATRPTDPTKTGYTFSRWLDETNNEFNFTTTKVTKDYNLTATYTLDTYQLNLDLAGGTAGTPANPISYNYEDNDITLTNPTKDGHDFLGWTGEGITTPTPTITIPKNSTGDKSYIANWKIKTYTVSFDADGGTPTPQPQTINHDNYATKPTADPQKTGHTFKGWQLNNANFDFDSTKITSDITLVAGWMLNCNPNSICYDDNGANSPTAMGSQTQTPVLELYNWGSAYEDITSNSEVKLWASNFQYDGGGYGFAGWNTKADGTGTTYGPNEIITVGDLSTEGLTLYAVWVKSVGNIQNWDGCSSLAQGAVTALTDTRDNNTYAVAKLVDGNCWMIENMRLGGANQITLTPSDSDVSSNFTLSASSDYADWCDYNNGNWITVESACIDQSVIYADTTISGVDKMTTPDANIYSYGNYYNWYSATAGSGNYSFATKNQNASSSICPTGWHIPTSGGKDNEQNSEIWQFVANGINNGIKPSNYDINPYPHYEGAEAIPISKLLKKYPNNFVDAGVIWFDTLFERNFSSYLPSSTSSGATSLFGLNVLYDGVYPTNLTIKHYGTNLRCLIAP